MTFVSLTTDYGNKDYYAAALRVKILERVSGKVDVVDLTHHIEPFSIAQAAYQVESAMALFPMGSIHCVDVASGLNERMRYVLLKFRGQYIVCCDNGLPQIVMEYGAADFFLEIADAWVQHPSFAALDIFPRVVEHLVNGLDPLLLGTAVEPQGGITLKPIVHDKMIRASVIHVDSYENLVLNIRKHEFDHTANGRNFVIQIRRGSDVKRLSTQYADVQPHELAAFFNTSGYLEVGLNQGNLAGINNIQIGDVVQIDFD